MSKDYIIFSSIDWDVLWQLHQQLATSLIRDNNRVLFIENTGVRNLKISDSNRLIKKIKSSIHLIAIDSDLYFFSYQDKLTFEKAKKSKKNIYYNEIKSIHGHDAFLIENVKMSNILKPIFNKK